MDFFDECFLNVLRDGKPGDFQQILEQVDFSHNTLRLHLKRLVHQGLMVKEKRPQKVRAAKVHIFSASKASSQSL